MCSSPTQRVAPRFEASSGNFADFRYWVRGEMLYCGGKLLFPNAEEDRFWWWMLRLPMFIWLGFSGRLIPVASRDECDARTSTQRVPRPDGPLVESDVEAARRSTILLHCGPATVG